MSRKDRATKAYQTARVNYHQANIAYAEAHHAMTNACEAVSAASQCRMDAWLKLKRAARLAGFTEFSNARP